MGKKKAKQDFQYLEGARVSRCSDKEQGRIPGVWGCLIAGR